MKGLLIRTETGELFAHLRDRWGYVHTLTGTRVLGGYDVEVVLTEVPEDLWLPGDEDHFKTTASAGN